MAFIQFKTPNCIIRTNKDKNVDERREFICDSRSDISSLPTQNTQVKCSFGSIAFVIEDSSLWILNSSGAWTEIK